MNNLLGPGVASRLPRCMLDGRCCACAGRCRPANGLSVCLRAVPEQFSLITLSILYYVLYCLYTEHTISHSTASAVTNTAVRRVASRTLNPVQTPQTIPSRPMNTMNKHRRPNNANLGSAAFSARLREREPKDGRSSDGQCRWRFAMGPGP